VKLLERMALIHWDVMKVVSREPLIKWLVRLKRSRPPREETRPGVVNCSIESVPRGEQTFSPTRSPLFLKGMRTKAKDPCLLIRSGGNEVPGWPEAHTSSTATKLRLSGTNAFRSRERQSKINSYTDNEMHQ
jgi:hypothetical protein